MATIINWGINRCVNTDTKVWDKTTFLKQYAPWVDLAIGIIFCIVGTLASKGYFVMPGYQAMLAVGALQIITWAFFKIEENCGTCIAKLKACIRDRIGH